MEGLIIEGSSAVGVVVGIKLRDLPFLARKAPHLPVGGAHGWVGFFLCYMGLQSLRKNSY